MVALAVAAPPRPLRAESEMYRALPGASVPKLPEYFWPNDHGARRFAVAQTPAMIAFRLEHGQVFLSAPHLEIEESKTAWGTEFQDPESDWPILDQMIRDMTHGASHLSRSIF